jgi:hypothetical protein
MEPRDPFRCAAVVFHATPHERTPTPGRRRPYYLLNLDRPGQQHFLPQIHPRIPAKTMSITALIANIVPMTTFWVLRFQS